MQESGRGEHHGKLLTFSSFVKVFTIVEILGRASLSIVKEVCRPKAEKVMGVPRHVVSTSTQFRDIGTS